MKEINYIINLHFTFYGSDGIEEYEIDTFSGDYKIAEVSVIFSISPLTFIY